MSSWTSVILLYLEGEFNFFEEREKLIASSLEKS